MGARWTPGPWIVAEGDGQYLWEVRAPNEPAKARRTIARPSGRDRLANARLIAAAPDLAEALEQAAEALERAASAFRTEVARQTFLDEAAAARAALSKARGETE